MNDIKEFKDKRKEAEVQVKAQNCTAEFGLKMMPLYSVSYAEFDYSGVRSISYSYPNNHIDQLLKLEDVGATVIERMT
ncbi:hypothetical protein C5167_023823 [Papaver somniferum]|uniref:Uncharacterized protein n=1 Tax=Papaver somniferum TaxID=3469 RepID=A0A4Y7JLW5_PAPSO|nr:hypothetical protein C5167_023823 [Papaver somniferum]